MYISYLSISLSILCFLNFNSEEGLSPTSTLSEKKITCDAPNDVVLFENGNKPALFVKPNTN